MDETTEVIAGQKWQSVHKWRPAFEIVSVKGDEVHYRNIQGWGMVPKHIFLKMMEQEEAGVAG
jgi:hypothetical protein